MPDVLIILFVIRGQSWHGVAWWSSECGGSSQKTLWFLLVCLFCFSGEGNIVKETIAYPVLAGNPIRVLDSLMKPRKSWVPDINPGYSSFVLRDTTLSGVTHLTLIFSRCSQYAPNNCTNPLVLCKLPRSSHSGLVVWMTLVARSFPYLFWGHLGSFRGHLGLISHWNWCWFCCVHCVLWWCCDPRIPRAKLDLFFLLLLLLFCFVFLSIRNCHETPDIVYIVTCWSWA